MYFWHRIYLFANIKLFIWFWFCFCFCFFFSFYFDFRQIWSLFFILFVSIFEGKPSYMIQTLTPEFVKWVFHCIIITKFFARVLKEYFLLLLNKKLFCVWTIMFVLCFCSKLYPFFVVFLILCLFMKSLSLFNGFSSVYLLCFP